MVSASSSNSSTKKRTAAAASSTSTSNKKPSPLYNKPQKRYVPQNKSTMTPEELSDWRKEQQRKRNKETAAKHRIKTRSRIIQLENEVEGYKKIIEEMKHSMVEIQTRISFLNNNCTSLLESKPHPTTSNDPVMRSDIVPSPAFPPMGGIITTHRVPTQTSESIGERAHLALTRSSRAASDMVDDSTRDRSMNERAHLTLNNRKEDVSNSKFGDNDDNYDDDFEDDDRCLLGLLERALGDGMNFNPFT